MRHRTHPKDGLKKAKDTLHELKSQIKALEKENRFLKNEIETLARPVKVKSDLKPQPQSYDQWRRDFVRRFKAEVIDKK
jgi:chromosome condensin MukBEF ATPase and DNA-binding subunit MukB